MSDLKILGEIAGNAPNEIWSRTGQIISLFSVVSILGFNIAGVGASETTQYAPYLTLLAGFFGMYMGYRIRKNAIIAESAERRQNTSDRVVSQPSIGDEAFLEEFEEAAPMDREVLESLVVGHDKKKARPQLIATINRQRFNDWQCRGKVVEYGNQFMTRKQFEEKAEDQTIYGASE